VDVHSDGAQTGRFSYHPDTGEWGWDDEVFRIHGFSPGSVTPTTRLVLSHSHIDDASVTELLERCSQTGKAFSISYRLMGADDVVRRVVMVAEAELRDGAAARVQGYYVDLTEEFGVEAEEAAQQAVAAAARSRAVIDEAKGALMLAYGLDPDEAFAMLRWWSGNRNIKVRELAELLVDSVRGGLVNDEQLRGSVDALLHDISGHAPVVGRP